MNSTEESSPSHTPETDGKPSCEQCSGHEHCIVCMPTNGTLTPALTYSGGIRDKYTNYSSFPPDKIAEEEGIYTSGEIRSLTVS